MEDVLSQREIDALLSAISAGEMDADKLREEKAATKIRTYDFKRALRFSKDQIRSITRIHENFARLLTTYLSAQLRTYAQISVASVEQLTYEEFIRSIPPMTILNIFEAAPLEGRLLIEVNPNVAYSMIDRLMGGYGTSNHKADSLTEIDTRIISQLLIRSLTTYREAWSSMLEIHPEPLDFEVNPQFIQMVAPNETVIVVSLSTTIGETSGMMNVCLPHVVLEPIIPKLSEHTWMQNKRLEKMPEETALIEQRIKTSSLLLVAELGQSSLTVEEFLSLDAGDIIQLNKLTHEPLTVTVENNQKFLAQPGKARSRMAVQIIEQVEEGE